MGANWPLYCYATMGNGTAHMIHLYGTAEQKEKYVRKLTVAQWGGTMLLTEPGAGSGVGALTTAAARSADGTYSLTGEKIFITNGECDLFENIIRPVLARIEGDPPGTRGISLFWVPKYLINDDGSLGGRNDIVCTGVEEKHGIHASATCSMALGSRGRCAGYLLGEKCKGMKIMFHMINHARMGTGLQAMSCASSAYLLAVNCARERIQGRDIESFADHSAPSVALIHHPDVRRNLPAAFAHALPFLYAMGDTIMAWMLLRRAVVATQKPTEGSMQRDVDFYEGLIHTLDFFIHTELLLTLARMDAVDSGCAAALNISEAGFGGL